MTFGSLFSGFGGLDLGLERAGLRCEWQVENHPPAIRVLEKHWPEVPRHHDAKTFPPADPQHWLVDLIAGGFPCQPVSAIAATSGRRKGVEDERWMWPEFASIVGRIRPRMVLIENVPGLISAGLGDVVRGDLESLGYSTDPWETIGACCVGAPHIRRRVFLVAYPDGTPLQRRRILADLARATRSAARRPPQWEWCGGTARYRAPGTRGLGVGSEGWSRDPGIRRVGDGVSSRMVEDRIRGIGNAVVPQVGEAIGRRIMSVLQEANR
jgi:DNA (cytosine-5)-methyltransferase 1